MKTYRNFLVAIFILTSIGIQFAQEKDNLYQSFELELQTEYQYFFNEGLFPGQSRHFPSFSLRPKYQLEWNDGYEQVNLEGFFRWDRDGNRTHWDIRELYYQFAESNLEFSVGLKKVFWGVTESIHLVDIINQTDQVESFDGEEKLGQPMVQVAWIHPKWGTFELYYMPYHRRRQFAGEQGRLRFPVLIDDELEYESENNRWQQDLAIRWKHYFGPVDIGFSHFYGNGREPMFLFTSTGEVNAYYPIINQTGLDLQVTSGPFLWKWESIYRSSDEQNFFALAAGLEYTLSNIDGNGLDIGLLAEYLYDERNEWALSAMQNDLFVGSRIAFNDINDTSVLLGGIFDLEKSSKIFAVEASRRVGTDLSFAVEARIFSKIDERELLLSNFRNDSFVKVSLSKFF